MWFRSSRVACKRENIFMHSARALRAALSPRTCPPTGGQFGSIGLALTFMKMFSRLHTPLHCQDARALGQLAPFPRSSCVVNDHAGIEG
jgi:hypothetical protein